MQARPLKDDGCTVVDAPYKEEDLDASKLGVDTLFPVLRSPWLKVASDFVKAPVYSTFITPNSPWLVPMMFGQILMQGNMRIELTWTLFAEPKMEFDQLALKSKPLPVFDPPDPVPFQSCCTTL